MEEKRLQNTCRYLYIVYGSICELETQVLLSGGLGYIKTDRILKLQCDIGEVEGMLKALIKSLENKHLNPRIFDHFLPTNWDKTLK